VDYDGHAISYACRQHARVIEKIIAAGRLGMKLCGMLPKANGWVDHQTEFADRTSIEAFLRNHFGTGPGVYA
jgi:hypothetical protein